MADCKVMSSLVVVCILCTTAVSIVYGSDIRCYICNSVDHSDCGIDGSRLIAELNSTFLRPCSQTNSVCSLSYKMTTTERGNATRRHSYARGCIASDERVHLQSSAEKVAASDAGRSADTVVVKDLTAPNTKLRVYFCAFSGCNYKYPDSELDHEQQFSVSCYNCSSTASGDSCGFILAVQEAEQVLTVCPPSHLCLSSFRQDMNSLTKFGFNRSCVSETEVTILKRIYGSELIGIAADSSDQIRYFTCDSPGCNDVFPGSNITSISCFVCNESTTICNDIDGRGLGTAAGKDLLRPCPTEEAHHCAVTIFYDSKKGAATKIDRQCMLNRLVEVYQQSGGGEAPIIETSDPTETFYMSFCRTTGCNRAFGYPDLLPKPSTQTPPFQPPAFEQEMEKDMQEEDSAESLSSVSLTTLLIGLLVGTVCAS